MISLLPSNKRHLERCLRLSREIKSRDVLILDDIALADSRTRTNKLFSSNKCQKFLRPCKLFARTFPGLKAVYKIIKYGPTHLILFNDFLFCEKVVIWVSRGFGIKILLIQEGFLPLANSANYLGTTLHSSPFGSTRKSSAVVFSPVASLYIQKFRSTENIVLTVDDFWDSRFNFNSKSRNILFFASDFSTGSRNLIAGEYQNTLFDQLSEILRMSDLDFKIIFVPHPNEGAYEGELEGAIALGFNTYALEELVGVMPVFRLDFGFATKTFIEEIREQTFAPFLNSAEQLVEVLKNFDSTSFVTGRKRSTNKVIFEIENLINT